MKEWKSDSTRKERRQKLSQQKYGAKSFVFSFLSLFAGPDLHKSLIYVHHCCQCNWFIESYLDMDTRRQRLLQCAVQISTGEQHDIILCHGGACVLGRCTNLDMNVTNKNNHLSYRRL